jgi:hypothetical protein
MYHHTNSPTLSTPFRRQREVHWIGKLVTAFPYGCNDNIGSTGNISSSQCSNVNVMELFNNTTTHKRNHGHHAYIKPMIHDVSFDPLFYFMWIFLWVHTIFAQNVTLCRLKFCMNYMKKPKLALNWIHKHWNTDLCIWLWMLLLGYSLVPHVLLTSENSRNITNSAILTTKEMMLSTLTKFPIIKKHTVLYSALL